MRIGESSYQVIVDHSGGYMEERGRKGARKLAMLHAMGGKNVYYFLTPLDRGRLQVLPLAYDVRKKVWFDMAASGVRMHDAARADTPLPWTDSAFTFNTSCYSCHVSQLKTNYDPATDTYRSNWREPGINCETCHGNGEAHVALYMNNKGEKVDEPRIHRTSKLTVQQRNEMCAPCHAKMSPISSGYEVTQKLFDHYHLVTLEDADYYPDGRDLGENYTYTSWLMSPCVRGGKLDCLHCHTSSGGSRFAADNPNGTCLPCHSGIAANIKRHSHHEPDGPGGKCVNCHMPTTRFANMNRSDHSMLPPTPSATLKYQSPNACNSCHKDRDTSWADAQVRKWYRNDYQKPVLDRAALIDAARKRDWARLPAMLDYLVRKDAEPIVKASLLRLLRSCDDPGKWSPMVQSLGDPDPLVRAAAAGGFAAFATVGTPDALIRAAGDEFRLVRISAADSLVNASAQALPPGAQESVAKATVELLNAYKSRPDNFTSHTGLGNFYMDRGDLNNSIRSFETAIRLRPDSVGTLVNASLAYSRAGRTADAERVLNQALRHEPNNAPANFNRGLLLVETGNKPEAEAALRRALAADPGFAAAAYNLCVLLAGDGRAEALTFCRQAAISSPQNEKYAFTLAFYQDRFQRPAESLRTLEEFSRRGRLGVDSLLFLANLYAHTGKVSKALDIFISIAAGQGVPQPQRQFAAEQIRSLQSK